jgi:CHAT domain-containing protein/tetratricopeptide (TPR) repeat protein
VGWRDLLRRRGSSPASSSTTSTTSGAPDPAEVARALEAYLGAESWEATCAALERDQAILLTDAATARLQQTIDEAASQPGQEQRAASLKYHLNLLGAARTQGLGPACDAFLAEQQRQVAAAQARVPLVVGWLNLPSMREARRYCQEHTELLEPESDRVLDSLLHQYAGQPTARQSLLLHQAILRDARARGGDATAIAEAFVDEQGGLTLDVPGWLAALEQRAESATGADVIPIWREALSRARQDSSLPAVVAGTLQANLWEALYTHPAADRAGALEEGIVLLRDALGAFPRDRYPQQWAMITSNLALTLTDRPQGARATNLDEAIAGFQAALEVFTPAAKPLVWAITQNNLGDALRQRISGDRADNYEQALAHFTAALDVYTRELYPAEWANTQNNLGVLYGDRLAGDRAENLEQAIACYLSALEIFTHQSAPAAWAMTQNNLGIAYKNRIRGDAAENLERSIACYSAALTVRTRDAMPADWGATQNNLGKAFADRVRGERAENLEQAITCFATALEVRTRENAPVQWAMTQNNLGEVYLERVQEDHAANVERAIACFTAALQVYTREAFPVDWASAQNALGNAYAEATGEDAPERFEQAIACYEAALTIQTEQAFPRDWAGVQNNLGNTYRNRIRGDRADNVERAIACYTAALRVFTAEALPRDWAATQTNLGNAYVQRVRGDRAANIDMAIACHEATLRLYTEVGLPNDWALTQLNLGSAYYMRVTGGRAQNLERAIACTQAALRIYTRAALPSDWARAQHNLGKCYGDRVLGDHAENIEQAIACHTGALEVYSRDAAPTHWAMLQLALGTDYVERIRGRRAENLELAIACERAALEVYTEADFPVDWALAQNNLGNTYSDRVLGERADNIERAIACYEAALHVRRRESLPQDWAATRLNMGSAYSERIREDHGENVERAIACYTDALAVFTQDALPLEWAKTQNNLGSAYTGRSRGESGENLDRAILCYQATLEVYTRESLPQDWARAQANLGNVLYGRIRGDRAENLEQAIAHSSAALEVYTREAFPLDWAHGQINLARSFAQRVRGDRRANLDQAVACLHGALSVYTQADAPVEWARAQHNLGMVHAEWGDAFPQERDTQLEQAVGCYRQALMVRTLEADPADHRQTLLVLAEAEAGRARWEAAHDAYGQARAAEDLLLALSAGARGQDDVLREGRDAGTRHAYTLVRLGRLEEALVAVERGRARALAETRALAAADPARIRDEARRDRYTLARQRFLDAQAEVNRPWPEDLSETERRAGELDRAATFRAAQREFAAIVAEIRVASDPADFLPTDVGREAIWQATRRGAPGFALVYLLATPWGGLALAALRDRAGTERAEALPLPELTSALTQDLLQTELGARSGNIVGGFGHAQEGRGLSFISYNWPGATLAEKVVALRATCDRAGQVSTLCAAAEEIMAYPRIAALAAQPLDQERYAQIDPTFEHAYLQRELRRCLPRLGAVALHPVADWLLELEATGLTLVPCGALATFPLTVAPLNEAEADPAQWRTLGDALPATVVPSARTLQPSGQERAPRVGVAALGDPWPTPQELRWGEAEALTVAALSGNPTAAVVHEAATRQHLLDALGTAEVVDACCHGAFDATDFLRSRLLLGGGEALTLGDILDGAADLRGLRLLLLSACQTAILDLRGASEEVRSLAAGMVGAGAEAVLGALWSVDDKATYLLIVRFTQEWLPRRHEEPPAAALARARRWLRTVTNRELRNWQATTLPPIAQPVEMDDLTMASTRGTRFGVTAAVERIVASAAFAADDAQPYADPIFWSAFQITGW